MSAAGAPRPTYNVHKGDVHCISCAKDKAMCLSRKKKSVLSFSVS